MEKHSLAIAVWLALTVPLQADPAESGTGRSVSSSDPLLGEVVLSGLDTPCGVAVRPDVGEVYVAESGAGRILLWKESGTQTVVQGFATAPLPWLHGTAVGPLGMAFVNRDRLVVGLSGASAAAEQVMVFGVKTPRATAVTTDLPPDGSATSEPADTTSAVSVFGPVVLPAFRGQPKPAELGDFWNVAADAGSLYVAAHGTSRPAIAFVRFRDTITEPLMRFLESPGVDGHPLSLAISPDGHLVVGNVSPDGGCQVTFYNARSGKQLLQLPVPLRSLVGLAFHPQTGLLYGLESNLALPFADSTASASQELGRLVRLDSITRDGRPVIEVVTLQSLARPTAMAFDTSGKLYVTVLGTAPKSGAMQTWDIP